MCKSVHISSGLIYNVVASGLTDIFSMGGRISEVDIEGFPSDLPQLLSSLYRDERKQKSLCHRHETYVLHSCLNFLVPILLSDSLCFFFNLIYKTIGECRPGLNVICWLKSFFSTWVLWREIPRIPTDYRYCKLGESIIFLTQWSAPVCTWLKRTQK